MATKQTLPRLFSGPFSKRGFEQTVPNFSFKECNRIDRDAGRFCRLSLVGTAPAHPYGPGEFGGHRIGYVPHHFRTGGREPDRQERKMLRDAPS